MGLGASEEADAGQPSGGVSQEYADAAQPRQQVALRLNSEDRCVRDWLQNGAPHGEVHPSAADLPLRAQVRLIARVRSPTGSCRREPRVDTLSDDADQGCLKVTVRLRPRRPDAELTTKKPLRAHCAFERSIDNPLAGAPAMTGVRVCASAVSFGTPLHHAAMMSSGESAERNS
jgi:hypothetical protein